MRGGGHRHGGSYCILEQGRREGRRRNDSVVTKQGQSLGIIYVDDKLGKRNYFQEKPEMNNGLDFVITSS